MAATNRGDSTVDTGATEGGRPEAGPLPRSVGRYEVRSILGRGAFGTVYLAFDAGLHRQVAVKIPHAHLVDQGAFQEAFFAEARMLARLDHPHIVPVYDVGHTDQHPGFIVSKFIDGPSLATRLAAGWRSWREGAELVAAIADALHYAHRRGVVHRDVKPSNILLDADHTPYLADFGLALREEDYGRGGRVVLGSLNYMSPEQVRGEGHLVDGRADVFSLGVVMYELITGGRPFAASTREEVCQRILQSLARPPRQCDDSIPREIERICLRALERRPSDRYSTALDMAEDLRAYCKSLSDEEEHAAVGEDPRAPALRAGPSHASPFPSESSRSWDSQRAARVVPRGLRSFDEDDAEFFLEILPGPKDRHGVPEGLRFWKRKIESEDPEAGFRAGVIYGPSGCGKSSLLRAGLLPRLATDVVPVVVAATPQGTEAALRQHLLDALPQLEPHADLHGLLNCIRREGARVADDRKVLIVLDQFEQWLHAHGSTSEEGLVAALRQCDGKRLKVLLLVRNDFWMSISRFMRQLESPIQEGRNSAAVDLFDPRHARSVLHAFGHAYGALPERTDRLTAEQQAFLDEAIEALTESNRVVCVRLALFAQMVRDRPWVPGTLAGLGGASGMGVRFLEETFCGRGSPPEYRRLQRRARAVLETLLPPPGVELRGSAQSESQLAAAARLPIGSTDFSQLMRILNQEIRLLTPVDAQVPAEAGSTREAEPTPGEQGALSDAAASPSSSEGSPGGGPSPERRCYQLTHDYLVPSLRLWLMGKQRETAAGRAQLNLAERTSLWNLHREPRQLPTLWETLQIVARTDRRGWSPAERSMMRRAIGRRSKQLGLTVAATAMVLIASLWSRSQVAEYVRRRSVDAQIQQLLTADIRQVPVILQSLDADRSLSTARLQLWSGRADLTESEQLRVALALVDPAGDEAASLIDRALAADLPTMTVIRERLSPLSPPTRETLWNRLRDASQTPPTRLRAAVLLVGAAEAPEIQEGEEGAAWSSVAGPIVDGLLAEPPLELEGFSQLLLPIASRLMPTIQDRFYNRTLGGVAPGMAARLMARYAEVPRLVELLIDADAAQFNVLFPAIAARGDREAEALLQHHLQQRLPADAPVEQRVMGAAQVRNAAMALMRLGQFDPVLPVLDNTPDPTARTMILLQAHDFEVPLASLLEALDRPATTAARQALLLALEPYRAPAGNQTSEPDRAWRLLQNLARGESQVERSAALWVLGRWQAPSVSGEATFDHATVAPLSDAELAAARGLPQPDEGRDWWITSQGHTMKVVPAPVNFRLGPAEGERVYEASITPRQVTIPHAFAASVYEVTQEQYLRFRPVATFAQDVALHPHGPANKVSFVDAMQYCRWLSEQEGIAEEQMCYPPVAKIGTADGALDAERRSRTGYRLLTEDEWEYVCRAGATTPWFCGVDESHLGHFSRYALTADEHLWPVGSLRPNAMGLFDIAGNVGEWCHPLNPHPDTYPLRGGAYDFPARRNRSAEVYMHSNSGFSYTGIRVGRTLPSPR